MAVAAGLYHLRADVVDRLARRVAHLKRNLAQLVGTYLVVVAVAVDEAHVADGDAVALGVQSHRLGSRLRAEVVFALAAFEVDAVVALTVGSVVVVVAATSARSARAS